MYQTEATYGQYLFNLLYWLFIVFITYINKDSLKRKKWCWLLFYIFCLFSYWCTDYFTYRNKFYIGYFDSNYKDPIYEYFQYYSFGNFLIFRTLIWGTALFLYYRTIQRFDVATNFVVFTFAIFFLLTFSYARASLAMASYFWGLSLIIINKNKIHNVAIGIFFILISYYFHRSMFPLILLVPCCFLRFNKKLIFLSIILFPLIAFLTNRLLGNLLLGTVDLGESVSGFTDAASNYASYSNKSKNWKYMLTSFLDQSKFFVVYIYVVYIFIKSRKLNNIDEVFLRLLTITSIIIYISIVFLTTSGNGATEVIGYRYLFMSGIPLTILVGYIYKYKLFTSKVLYSVLIYTGLYGFVFIVGKLLSLS